MDDDTTELIVVLCTRAGMIMEDAAVTAIVHPKSDAESLRATLATLTEVAAQIHALVNAARMLADR